MGHVQVPTVLKVIRVPQSPRATLGHFRLFAFPCLDGKGMESPSWTPGRGVRVCDLMISRVGESQQ